MFKSILKCKIIITINFRLKVEKTREQTESELKTDILTNIQHSLALWLLIWVNRDQSVFFFVTYMPVIIQKRDLYIIYLYNIYLLHFWFQCSECSCGHVPLFFVTILWSSVSNHLCFWSSIQGWNISFKAPHPF